MGEDITIGVTEIVNNIEVTAQPSDQVIEIDVVDNSDEVTLNITPTVIEININKGSSFARWGTILGNLPDQEDLQNVLNLKADLVGGLVPASQLPSYVDDIVEVVNYAALPVVGETGKIYLTLDTNRIYRWSGSVYVEIASDLGYVHLAGTETITGKKIFQNDGSDNAIVVNNTLTGNGIAINNSLNGFGITINNSLNGYGINSNNTSSGYGIYSENSSNGYGISSLNSSTGYGAYLLNTSTGRNLVLNNNTDGTGIPFSIQKIGTDVFTINDAGEATGTKFTKSGGTSSQFLKADGSVDGTSYVPTSRTITANSPLTGGGDLSANRSISIPQSNTTTNGYLSSTDWTTFNSKQGALNGTGFVKVVGTTVSYDNSTYALDNVVVKLTGDQTIAGVKTFSSDIKSTAFRLTGGTAGTGLYYGHTNKVVLANYTVGGGIDFETNGGDINMTLDEFGRLFLKSSLIVGNISSTSNTLFRIDTNKAIFQIEADGATSGVGTKIKYTYGSGSQGSLRFVRSLDEDTMILAANGNVGIGTTSPGAKLDVHSVIRATNTSSASFQNAALELFTYNGTSVSAGTSLFSTNSNFNYGTIVSNQTNLYGVRDGGIRIATGVAPIVFSNGNADIDFASERMRITSGGDVAIGGTSGVGRVQIWGNSVTSAGYSLVTYNSSGFTLFSARNDGLLNFGTFGNAPYNVTTGAAANAVLNSNGEMYRSTSSLKYKKNVENYTKGLNEIMEMRPVTYNSKNESEEGVLYAGLIAEEIHDLGLTEFVQYANDGTPDALAYSNMISLLIKGIQELKAEIEILKNK